VQDRVIVTKFGRLLQNLNISHTHTCTHGLNGMVCYQFANCWPIGEFFYQQMCK